MFALACLCLFAYCLLLAKHTSITIESTPFLVICSLITALYCFAYMHVLYIGVLFILSLGLLLALYALYFLYQDKAILFQRYFTPGFVFGICLCIFALLIAPPIITGWDGCAFWGPLAKFIFLNRGFVGVNDIVTHKSYPPGTALFFNFFTWKNFNGATCVMAHRILIFAPLISMLSKINWEKWRHFIVYLVLGCISLLIMNRILIVSPMWRMFYMDIPAAVFFGMSMVYYQSSNKKIATILQLIPCVFALCLLKMSLFPLAFVLLCVISVDQLTKGLLYIRMKKKPTSFIKLIQANQKNIYTTVFSIIAFLAAFIIAIYSWKLYTVHLQAKQILPLRIEFNFKGLLNTFFLINLTPFQVIILKKFLIAYSRHILISVSFVLFAMIIGRFHHLEENKQAILARNIVLFVGSIFYGFGLLILYLHAFSHYESMHLASFYRYMCIYYLAWWFSLYRSVAYPLMYIKMIQHSKLYIGFITIGILLILRQCIHFYTFNSSKNWQSHQRMKIISDAVLNHIPLENAKKIFVVFQNSNGSFNTILKFNLTPLVLEWGKTIGPPYAKRDVWYRNWTPQAFLNQISNDSYLLLAYTDDRFWQQYGKIFPDQPQRMKPLVVYDLCIASRVNFNPFDRPGCKIYPQRAYLFKVLKHNGQVKLVNVVQ